jgi:non-heme chloroperoxidase
MNTNPNDPLGFSQFNPNVESSVPLSKFPARDDTQLGYRFYNSDNKDAVVILLHGSSSHGEYLHPFADYLSTNGCGQVFVPNLRGHFGSKTSHQDCTYIGQLEDDLHDLLEYFQLKNKEIYLCGHSSGGGLAIRFAGGVYGGLIKGYILLSPAIPRAPTMRGGDAGGWADPSIFKIISLSILNSLGITRFNNTKVIAFKKPMEYCDGKETLEYSYNLYSSYHPREHYQKDISALNDKSIVIIGSKDEANDPLEFKKIFPKTNVSIIEDAGHLDIVSNPVMMKLVSDWIKGSK